MKVRGVFRVREKRDAHFTARLLALSWSLGDCTATPPTLLGHHLSKPAKRNASSVPLSNGDTAAALDNFSSHQNAWLGDTRRDQVRDRCHHPW
jgi:hypothetical protein